MRRYFNPVTILLIGLMAFNAMTSSRYASPGDWFMSTILLLPAIVIGLSFHEFAHAAMAYKLGDMTPKHQGRVTIDPRAHIDVIGFIALIFIGFGWGQSVMINPRNFKKPRRDEFLVAIAGVLMNLIIAVLASVLVGILVKTGFAYGSYMQDVLLKLVINIVWINLVLMVFNLLPIPPLDGFNIIVQIFNLRNTQFYYKVYDKGMIILLVLILFNITNLILSPIVNAVYSVLMNTFVL